MADQYPWHVCVHHVESNGMILLGDLVFDIYQEMPHSTSCLHHCRTGTHSGCCLTGPPFGSPSLHKWGNKVLNLCNGMQLGCAPGSTLTSIIMVPALPGILMVISVMISDLLSGSVSVYSPSNGLLLALVLWDILLCTAKQENLLYVPSSSGPERTVFDTLPCFSLCLRQM